MKTKSNLEALHAHLDKKRQCHSIASDGFTLLFILMIHAPSRTYMYTSEEDETALFWSFMLFMSIWGVIKLIGIFHLFDVDTPELKDCRGFNSYVDNRIFKTLLHTLMVYAIAQVMVTANLLYHLRYFDRIVGISTIIRISMGMILQIILTIIAWIDMRKDQTFRQLFLHARNDERNEVEDYT